MYNVRCLYNNQHNCPVDVCITVSNHNSITILTLCPLPGMLREVRHTSSREKNGQCHEGINLWCVHETAPPGRLLHIVDTFKLAILKNFHAIVCKGGIDDLFAFYNHYHVLLKNVDYPNKDKMSSS
jgi:hypothetical protein